jgi:hypothetical protein
MAAHSKAGLLKLLPYAIANSKDDPPQSLIDFIHDNYECDLQMAIVAAHVLAKDGL